MKILVTDDSKAMRMIVIRTLRQAGATDHTIVEAENGKQGFDMVMQGGVDLVLSDWNMPEMSGIDFLRALRAKGSHVRFGFVTSESTPEMRQIAQTAGALFLIAKPFTPENFSDVLRRLGA